MKHFKKRFSSGKAMSKPVQVQKDDTLRNFERVSGSPRKEMLKASRTEDKLNRWQEQFRERSFYEKYQWLSSVSFGASWLFNLLSVAGGVLFVASLLASFVYPNLKLMLIPSLLLLALVEVVKRIILTNWIVEYLRSKTINKALILANIVFVVLSACASVGGGIELVQMTRGKQKPTLVNTKSIEQKYQQKIADVQRDRRVLEKSNTWRNNTYYSRADRELDNQHLSKIGRLETEQKQAIAKATKENTQKLQLYNAGTSEYILGFIIIALLIELFSIVSIIFPAYFKYRAIDEQDILVGNKQLVKFDIRGLHTLLNSTHLLAANIAANDSNILANPYPQLSSSTSTNTTNAKPFSFEYGKNLNSKLANKAKNYQKMYAKVNKRTGLKPKTENVPQPTNTPTPKQELTTNKEVESTAQEPTQGTLPLFPMEITQRLEGVEKHLTSNKPAPLAKVATTKEATIGVPPTPRRKRGRGTSLDYELIDSLIYEGELSNFDIAQKADCAESSITKRRRLLRKKDGETESNK